MGEVPPTGWPALPEEGEAFWSSKPSGTFRVAEGSALLMHSVTNYRVGTLSLFEISDDPQDVLQRYFQQSENGEDMPPITRWEREGTTVEAAGWSDGGGYTLRTYSREGEPTWLLLEAWPSD